MLLIHLFDMSDAPTPSLFQAAMSATFALAKITANHALPMKSWSTLALNDFEDTKRRLALSSDPIWLTTGVPTVQSFAQNAKKKKKKKMKTGWHIHLLKYKTERSTKEKRNNQTCFLPPIKLK